MRLTVLWRVAAKSDVSVSHCAFLFYTIVGRPWGHHGDLMGPHGDHMGPMGSTWRPHEVPWGPHGVPMTLLRGIPMFLGGGKVLLKTYIFQLGILFLRCRVERDTDVSGGQSAFENIYFPT